MDTNKFNSIFNEKYLKNSAAANSESTQADPNSNPTGKYYKYCRNFTDQSNQPKNYLIYHTKDDIIKSSGDIIEISVNGDIDKLTNVEYIKVDDLFAYVIITTRQADGKLYDHLLLAKIKNVLEIGAKHMIIARYYNAKSESGSENANNVVSAGVIKKTGDTTFIFNLDSGTYLSREDPVSKNSIKGITTRFFSKISEVNNKISFNYNANTNMFNPPHINQHDVDELCVKKKDEVLLVDKCDDKWENNYKIVKDAVKPPNSESICSAVSAEARAVAQANAAITQAKDTAKQSKDAQISAADKARALAESKAADKAETLLGKPAFEIEYHPSREYEYLGGRTEAIANTISNIKQIFYYYKYDRTTKLYKYINSKHDIIITFDTDYGWKIKKRVSTANRGLVDNFCHTGNVNKERGKTPDTCSQPWNVYYGINSDDVIPGYIKGKLIFKKIDSAYHKVIKEANVKAASEAAEAAAQALTEVNLTKATKADEAISTDQVESSEAADEVKPAAEVKPADKAKDTKPSVQDEAANTKAHSEASAIINASTISIEFVIKKISVSNYLKPMNEKMTDLLKIMKEIVII
jgi:hypothetical protein